MSSTTNDASSYKLHIKTSQISPFKTLMTALKDILLETNIKFTKNGMTIVNMDKSHNILVHLFLEADGFEEYICNETKIVLGVNIFHLFKIINTVDTHDILSIYIDNEDYEEGVVKYLTICFNNDIIRQQRIYKLRLIEPTIEYSDIPSNIKYSSIINLPSNDFQKIVRDLSHFSNRLEIKSVGDELWFNLKGPYANVQIRRSECDETMKYIQKQDEKKIIQGEFSLKYLNYFIKCTNLCNSIELLLGNNLPLIVKYDVPSLGEIKLCLAPLECD